MLNLYSYIKRIGQTPFYWLGGAIIGIVAMAVYYQSTYISTSKEISKLLDDPKLASTIIISKEDIEAQDSKITLEEKVEYLRNQQLYILERQSELVNDFRQEMNNNINKMNTWIGCGLGLMAIIGVIVPVLFQIHIHAIEKDEFNEFCKTEHANIDRLEAKVIQDYKDNKHKIDQSIENLKILFKHKEKGLDEKSRFQNLLVSFLSFKHGCDENILKNQSDRNQIMRYIWQNAMNSYHEVVKDCLSDEESFEKRRSILVISLIMLHSMMDKLKAPTFSRDLRSLNHITDRIRRLLPEIEFYTENHTFWIYLQEQMEYIDDALRRIPVIFNH